MSALNPVMMPIVSRIVLQSYSSLGSIDVGAREPVHVQSNNEQYDWLVMASHVYACVPTQNVPLHEQPVSTLQESLSSALVWMQYVVIEPEHSELIPEN